MSGSNNPSRQPKGQSSGGQFAPSKNPESTVALPPEGDAPLSLAAATANIHRHLDASGRSDPNERGLDLINRSRMEITGELETHNGIAWTGRLTIGDDVLDVSNSGDGGSNRYQLAGGGWQRIDEINDAVSDGFPGLAGPEALDGFCLIAEVARFD